MVNFPTRITDCESHNPTLLDLFISSDASICSTMASLHWEILVMLLSQFPSNSQLDATFHRIAYDYSRPDCEHLRISPW